MDRTLLDEVRGVLSHYGDDGRVLFPYFRDRYALMLLSWASGAGLGIGALKASRWARLLSRPPVREVLAHAGSGAVSAWDLGSVWPEHHTFRLALGEWEGKDTWGQTSRAGWNLVLQLNFSGSHDQAYARMRVPDDQDCPFSWSGHPVSKRRHTLAWARIDLDLDTGEALIEEVQNDWLREVQTLVRQHSHETPPQAVVWPGVSVGALRRYAATVLPLRKIWHEAMLAAALQFLRDEIGIAVVWMHTWKGGCANKSIDRNWAPPRSVYTDLPKRFCFDQTADAPEFLLRSLRRKYRKRVVAHPWWRMRL